MNRIHLDIAGDSLKFGLVTNQPVVAFLLPERLINKIQDAVPFPGCESFERLHHFGNLNQWSDQ